MVAHSAKNSGEWSRYYYRPDLHKLEALHARFVEHRFSPHVHDYYVIGYIESGVQSYRWNKTRQITPAGHVGIVNPGDVHTGEAATPEGYVYRTIYPKPSLMKRICAEVFGRPQIPSFRTIVSDGVLSRRLIRFHRALAEGHTRLALESLLFSAIAYLVIHYAELGTAPQSLGSENQAIRSAIDYLEAHFATDISLSSLSETVGLSPYYFARVFEHKLGLPPHRYLDAVRIRKAREMLDDCMPISQVALAVGYGDQSHLTHRFKRLLGITPGLYVRERKIRQDALP